MTTCFEVVPDEPFGFIVETKCPECSADLSAKADEIDGGYEVLECDRCGAYVDMHFELVVEVFPKDVADSRGPIQA